MLYLSLSKVMVRNPADRWNCEYYFGSVVLSQGNLLPWGHLVAVSGHILMVTLGEKRGGSHWHLVGRSKGCTGQAPTTQNYPAQMSIVPRLRNAAAEARNFGQENSDSKSQFPTVVIKKDLN